MDIKSRKVFSIKNFRGMDKENKPSKVAFFRASDGYNFIIDSGTLKTRPAIKYKQELPFVLGENEKLIDWYTFKSYTFYVTNFNIHYIQSNTLQSVFIDNKDFSGKRPIFQEEKEALFVFGLDAVYIIGIIGDNIHIYDIKSKPVNPYSEFTQTEFHTAYEKLPEPYIPTLFIGDNAFEDINLLSNKQKYQIFAATSQFNDNKENIYYLPTVYDAQKHGGYSSSISLYENQFDDIEGFPVFIGEYDSGDVNFENTYGTIYNPANPIEITDVFYPTRDFEYFWDEQTQTKTYIYDELNLTKVDFFKLYIAPLKQTTFEYCMWFLENTPILDNKVLLFSVKAKYTAILRDETDNKIIRYQQEESTYTIAVQLRKYEGDVNFSELGFDDNVLVDTETPGYIPVPSDYPAYETFSGVANSPHEFEMSQVELSANSSPEMLAIVSSRFEDDARNLMLSKINTCSLSQYDGDKTACTTNGGTWYFDEGDQIWVKGRYYFILVDPYGMQLYYYYYSMSAIYEYTQEAITTSDSLYEISFNDKAHRFELRIKDYFYDYRNEPSVVVTIIFDNNPDYDLIAKCEFGTTFGSENRLFLAGHPDYPNIDRYNVSNDLLGNLTTSQSYELSYFPSKNYRVIGGKGAINGYAIGTDNILYVTKKEYSNDNKLFIRERILDENGVVGYREYKTSVNRTPLNHRSIVRFNNDIIMLTKDGLYGIELSSNVLTDERLIKLRSGFLNKDIKEKVSQYDNDSIFILENNIYMYIIIGDNIYVADSRYIDKNENSLVDNLSYEMIHWKTFASYTTGKVTETDLTLLEKDYNMFYELVFGDADDKVKEINNTMTFNNDGSANTVFQLTGDYDGIFDKKEEYTIITKNSYKIVAKQTGLVETSDYVLTDNVGTILNSTIFRNVVSGDVLYFKDGSDVFHPFVITISEDRTTFTFDDSTLGIRGIIYISTHLVPLYITTVYDNAGIKTFNLSPYDTTNVLDRDIYDFGADTSPLNSVFLKQSVLVEMKWVSAITDFGNDIMEKTMFRCNLYATKQQRENIIKIGYKTMRRLRRLEDQTEIAMSRQVDLSNAFSFDEVEFNLFALNTFNDFGTSLPLKENNFLYIQFMILGQGQIELNAIEVIYKDNRMLKTIG